jgi:hypothetical protein
MDANHVSSVPPFASSHPRPSHRSSRSFSQSSARPSVRPGARRAARRLVLSRLDRAPGAIHHRLLHRYRRFRPSDRTDRRRRTRSTPSRDLCRHRLRATAWTRPNRREMPRGGPRRELPSNLKNSLCFAHLRTRSTLVSGRYEVKDVYGADARASARPRGRRRDLASSEFGESGRSRGNFFHQS